MALLEPLILYLRYCKAVNKACEGEAKRKYFEHAGALMTADASGDKLLKFEGVPKGTEFNFYR